MPEDFKNKYKELKSEKKMAEFYGVDRHVISDYCKKIDFDDSIYKRKKLTEKQIQYIVDNYNNKSEKIIAKELEITEYAVSGVWHRHNLKGKTRRVYSLLNEDYFEKINSQDKAYFLGFIGADGCLYSPKEDKKQKILRIEIHKQDIEILEIFKEYLQTDKPICHTGDYVGLEISSDKIYQDIEKLGLSDRKTYGNTIANVPECYMPALIRGYFDGDGNIGNNQKILSSSVSIAGYHTNLQKIQEFLEKRNIYSSFVSDSRKNTSLNGSDFGSLCLVNKTAKYSFLKLIYQGANEVYLKRKFNRSMNFIKEIENSKEIRDKQIINYYTYAVQKVS